MESATGSVRAEDLTVGRLLAGLQDRIGPKRYNAWFTRGTRVSIEEGRVKVAVPNEFVANWIEAHYHADIVAAAQDHAGSGASVLVTIDPTLSGEIRRRQLDTQAAMVDQAAHGRSRARMEVQPQRLRHRIEDFVVGESNRLAYSMAVAVASAEKPPFNPLLVHGSCGVGKTHLLQGICDLVSRHRREGHGLLWRYVTGEQFTNEFISALRAKKLEEFRARYRRLDMLAIDDVHFLAAKKATQDEFLHTYNAIESAGKQIVMASDAHPRLVGDLNEQLVSRFLAGMVVKIDTPDLATRMEILRRGARRLKLHVAPEVLEYVAIHARGSVRELEGAIVKLAALAALESGPVTLQMATEALADHLARTDSAITLGDIEAAAAAFFGITPADIHSTRRTRTVSVARMIAMFLARRHTRMSYPEIGKFMGKNHSSAVLAVQRMEKLLAGNEEIEWMTPMGPKRLPASKLIQMLTEQFARTSGTREQRPGKKNRDQGQGIRH